MTLLRGRRTDVSAVAAMHLIKPLQMQRRLRHRLWRLQRTLQIMTQREAVGLHMLQNIADPQTHIV